MKHQLGNSPKCNACYWFKETAIGEKNLLDGWCINPYQCSHGINGRKLERPKEKISVRWNQCCHRWEEAVTRLTHFEVSCLVPEPSRTEQEKRWINEIFRKYKERKIK